ncbi:ApeP family dehydratase [Eionea flava]
MNNRFDSRIFDLIPHRPPMLLINRILNVDINCSSSLVLVDPETPFFEKGKGVPAWVGIEYMGQTAALIAGHRLMKKLIEPHLGFLIGTRSYNAEVSYFKPGTTLKVSCIEGTIVAEGFTKFDCEIANYDAETDSEKLLATSSLSVFRRPITQGDS